MKRRLVLYVFGLSLIVILAGLAQGYPLTAALSSTQVVPQNASSARGNCRVVGSFTGDWGTDIAFTVSCDFSGLSGPLIDADIRQAVVGQNGDGNCGYEKQVMVTLPNTGSGTVTINCVGYAAGGNLTEKGYYIVLQTAGFTEGEVRGQIKPVTLDLDVNGEGRSEISVFRPSDRVSWAYCDMSNGPIVKQLVDWQPQTDGTPFLADLDSDGIAEWAFVRTSAVNGVMNVLFRNSQNGQLWGYQIGNANLGDIPVFGDYSGDGKIDFGVFRSSTGTWYIPDHWGENWGRTGDTPCAGDYDGDGKMDLCVARSDNGLYVWYVRRSSDYQISVSQWGLSTDTLYPNSPVDVDADGSSDLLVSRDENGKRVFYALRSSDGSMFALQWGFATDAVKIGDYDGDGKTDFAAIRETDGHLTWFINQSSNGLRTFQWGLPGDL